MEYTLTARSPGEEIIPATYDDSLLWSAGVGFVHHNFDLNLTLASRPPVEFDIPQPVDPMEPTTGTDEDAGLGALVGGVPTLMVSSVYRFGKSRYHEIKPTEELYPVEQPVVQPIYQVIPAPATNPAQGNVRDAPSTSSPVQGAEGDTTEEADDASTREIPTTDVKKSPQKGKDGLMGTPPPPGSDDLFVPANP